MARNLFPQGKSFEELNTRFNDVLANQPVEEPSEIRIEKEEPSFEIPRIACKECKGMMDARNGHFCSNICETNFKFKVIRGGNEVVEDEYLPTFEEVKEGYSVQKEPTNWKSWALEKGKKDSERRQRIINELNTNNQIPTVVGRRHV